MTDQIRGTTRRINLGGLQIDVVVIDIKTTTTGQTKYKVSPVAGSGTLWTNQPGIPV